MRALNPFAIHEGALIGAYSTRLAEAVAVRRAELDARAARAEAELSIRARSEFLSNMNHELRTPLNAIIGFSTMLRDYDVYPMSDEQRRTYAEYIIQSADLLLGHINTILEMAALDSGAVEMHAGEVDLSEIVAGAVTRAAVAASAAKVTIENKTAKGEIAGWGDAQRIGQAVDHLLRTALHVSSGGGRILVRASVADGRWPEIAVRDYGAGFSRDEIRAALSAFDEVHRGLNRSFAGPGVGLAVAKTFVEMQGGIFEIKSKAGEGTIVRIMLPPAEAPSRAAAQENGAQPAGAVRKAS
jgi:two-component system cell cycle sensor histidine kinase PleC